MKQIHIDPSRFHVEEKDRDLFGEALENWFKSKAVYGIYKKFGRARTERIFNEMQKVNDHEWTHLMQGLHHG